MGRSIQLFVGIVIAAMLATPANAQPEALLILNGVSGCVTNCGVTIMQVAPTVPAVLSSAIVPDAQLLTSPYVTPDGRLLVWYEGSPPGSRPARVAVRDLLSGSTSRIDVPGATELLGNPARPEVYLLDGAGPFALAPSGMRRFNSPTCVFSRLLSVSGDGRRLLSYCRSTVVPSTQGETLIFNVDSGQMVASLPLDARALNHNGSEVYALSSVGAIQHLQRFDVATATLQAEVALPASPGGPVRTDAVRVDHRRNRVIWFGSSSSIFDGTSLQLLQSTGYWRDFPSSIAVDEVDRLIYMTINHAGLGGAYTSLAVFDADAFGEVASVPSNLQGWFVSRPKPAEPGPLVATVQPSAVSLSWFPVSALATTTRYVLEVGSAPGLNNIFSGLDVGLQTSFSASGVPAGRYYVRVRAGNYAGISAPSNEVVVQVP